MIVIVDYGMGNLRSVQKAFEKVGQRATITNEAAVVDRAAKIILPGVGAFCDARIELARRGLTESVRGAIRAGKPFLGICLGLQLLFDVSYEDGRHEGLGLLAGEVLRFELPRSYKVPHMGWNQVVLRRRPPIFQGVPDDAHFYFVHSYYVAPRDAELIAGETDYGVTFTSMIWRDNLYATQFHPEKSQREGLQVLKNFAELP